MPFTFYTIRDIRKCWLGSPDNSFWIVDYMANEKSILPLSVRYDDLSDEDKRNVISAYSDAMIAEGHTPIEVMDKFINEYIEILPNIQTGEISDLPYPVIISGGDVLEAQPYRPAKLGNLEDLPF